MKSYYSHYRFLSAAKGVFSTEFMPESFLNKELKLRSKADMTAP